MKKVLGVVFLCLLFCNSSFADTFKKLDVVYKDEDRIYIVRDLLEYKSNRIANNHCGPMGKRTFRTVEYEDRFSEYFKNKGHIIKGNVTEFLCSRNYIENTTDKSLLKGFRVYEVSDKKMINQTTQNSQSVDMNFTISEKKQQCEAIGFAPKTEKFADCVLRLVELDMKNQQSNNMIASQNKSQSDQFMSNALLNLGQQLMQPNSNIYNSKTKNCSVRKSFGNTSTVTCY